MYVKVPADRGGGAVNPRNIVTTRGQGRPARPPAYARPQRLRQTATTPKDHFIQRDGEEFAGTHLILDLWGATRLGDLAFIDRTMRDAVSVAGATLLHIHLHHFGEGGGVSGVAVLAESHISVHTWPERDFAAFDVFMCGDAEPLKAIESLKCAFEPMRCEVLEARRGKV